jgi:hypothetical protein
MSEIIRDDQGRPIIYLETGAEMIERGDRERAERVKGGRWGAWYLTRKPLCLGINRAYRYEIEFRDIEDCGPLHWFAHMQEKAWMTPEDLRDLINAFNDIFGYGWLYRYHSIASKANQAAMKKAGDIKPRSSFPEAE